MNDVVLTARRGEVVNYVADCHHSVFERIPSRRSGY